MEGLSGVPPLDAIQRPSLPELPPPLRSPKILDPVVVQTPTTEATPETLDMGDMFPPTGAEMAAMAEAEAAEKAQALPVEAKKFGRRRSDHDLTPKGYRAGVVFKFIAQLIAAIVVFGLIGLGYLMWQAVESAERVTELEAGECVEDFFSPSQGEFRNVFLVDTTDCINAHAYEVFAVSTSAFEEVTATESPYAGIEATFAEGQAYCRAQYDEFVGGDFNTSPWQVWTFVPTEKRWDDGDRRVQCLVGDAAQVTTVEGTLKDAGLDE